MKKVLNGLSYLAVFCGSFLVFLYLTFPYEVLKETVAAEISKNLGHSVRIGSMGPKLPLGIEAEDISIIPAEGAGMQVSRFEASVGILSLFLGKVDVAVGLASRSGNLDTNVDFSILKMIKGEVFPSNVSLTAKKFPIDDIAAFGMNMATSGDNANPMMAPLIEAIGISANLNGKLDLALDTDNPSLSTGTMNIQLLNANLKLSDPTLGLKDQVFSKALLKAKVSQGKLVIDKASGFLAEELNIGLKGRVSLNQALLRSTLEVDCDLKLLGDLNEKFGFIIDAATGSTKEGQLTISIRGSIARPAITTI